MRLIILGIVLAFVLLPAPKVYGAVLVPIDFDGNGKYDTALLGSTQKVEGVGMYSPQLSVTGEVKAIVEADLNKDGKLNEAVIVTTNEIIGISASGVMWRTGGKGLSAAAADLNGDGYFNEVVVGGYEAVYALNGSNGEGIWNFTSNLEGESVTDIAYIEDYIVFAHKEVVSYLTTSGTLASSWLAPGLVLSLTKIDLDKTGRFTGVVVLAGVRSGDNIKDVNITALDKYAKPRWSASKKHESYTPKELIKLFAMDKHPSDGKYSEVVLNLDYGVYYFSSTGSSLGEISGTGTYAFSATPSRTNTIALADFDGDGILDDIVVSSENTATSQNEGAGKIYAFAGTQMLSSPNITTGASLLAVIDADGDGKVNDVVYWNKAFSRMDMWSVFVSDTTTMPPQPPIISNVNAGSITQNSATITWTTDKDSTSVVEYGTTTSYGSSKTDAAYLKAHNITLGGLLPSTTYHYRVKSTDASGSTGTSTDYTFTTAAPTTPTTQQISVIINAPAQATEGQKITLTANATPSTPDGKIVTYLWTTNGKILGDKQTIEINNLSKGTYNITVKVTDSTGASADKSLLITVNPAPQNNLSAIDSDNDGLTDEQERLLKTNPYNADTDSDDLIDSVDPNPLVPESKGGFVLPSLNLALGPIINVVKWIVIGVAAIAALVYVREKILDFLWERRRDFME